MADTFLPRHKPGVHKDWWSSELSDLKNQSMDIHNLWVSEGRPRSGATQTERLRVCASYKAAIRKAQREPKQDAWNTLHTAMENDDTQSFWCSWRTLYNKNTSHFAPVVNGCSSKEAIAEAFRQSFIANSIPNNQHKVDELNHRFNECYQEFSSIHDASCRCHNYQVSLDSVIDVILSLKNGKCADEVGVHAEHFKHAPLNFLQRLTKLFNSMLRHSFVPKQFRSGYVIPIVKDTNGNLSDVANYRGITISPVMTKVFEHVMKVLFADHLKTSSSQFGFKKRNSTSHAIYCLKETINYYVNNGNRVYCGFLDASKAFDRLIHSGLYLKMIQRNFPKIFIDVIINWYDGLICRVLWDGVYSDWFHVKAGVRQGGVLSPDFYGLYVDDLFEILKSSGIGCYYVEKFAAALMYADDMALLAPSVKGLQKLLSICESFCIEWDIKLNAQKSKSMSFGKGSSPSYKLRLSGDEIDWVTHWKYLGVTLVHGSRFGCCIDDTLKKFYRSANAVLRVDGRSDDIVMLRLLETHCLSVLSYAIEVIEIADRKQKSKMRVAYNSMFRKLFGYSWRESVTELQHALGRPTWEELVSMRTENFKSKIHLFPMDSLVRALHA